MKGSSLGYLLKTGFKNVYMNRLMSFASIGVLVCLPDADRQRRCCFR